MKHRIMLLAISLFVVAGTAQSQEIALGLLDNFNNNTTQGWRHGAVSPNPPTVIPVGGPDGSQYLENLSTGVSGPGGRHLIQNTELRWTGDYIAAGVNKVRVNMINFGGDPLPMRVAFQRADLDCWASTNAHVVPPDAVWRNYEFLVDESTMTNVSGGLFPFEEALRNVEGIRIVASAEPSCNGDEVFGISGFDDVQTDADTDLDGINNSIDNCTLVQNPRQCIGDPSIMNQADCELAGFAWGQPDTDGDFYGNQCDADIAPQPGPFLSGDCVVNFVDLGILRNAFFAPIGSPNYNANADLAYNGIINFQDLQIFQSQFFGSPGPGLGNCGCAPEPSVLDPGENFAGLEMFVRGGLVLDWGATPQINSVSNLGGGNYQARFRITAGSYGYKVASGDWSVEFANDVDPTVIGSPVVLGPGAGVGNTNVTIPASGCYEVGIVPTGGDLLLPATDVVVTFMGPLP